MFWNNYDWIGPYRPQVRNKRANGDQSGHTPSQSRVPDVFVRSGSHFSSLSFRLDFDGHGGFASASEDHTAGLVGKH